MILSLVLGVIGCFLGVLGKYEVEFGVMGCLGVDGMYGFGVLVVW